MVSRICSLRIAFLWEWAVYFQIYLFLSLKTAFSFWVVSLGGGAEGRVDRSLTSSIYFFPSYNSIFFQLPSAPL